VSKCSSNLTSRFSVRKRASCASQSLVPRFFAPRVLFFTSLSLAELLIFVQHSPLTVPHSHSSYQHCDSSILSSRTCTPLTACAAYSRHTLLFSSPFSPKRYLCSRWSTIHRGGQEVGGDWHRLHRYSSRAFWCDLYYQRVPKYRLTDGQAEGRQREETPTENPHTPR
jgi:hypothetical protein